MEIHWLKTQLGDYDHLLQSLMHSVKKRAGIDFSSNHSLWTWAHRHAAWLMNRFGVVRNVTPYEIVRKKQYTGAIAQFAEPAFGFFRVGAKGTAKWRLALFLGKVDGQDSFLLYSGSHLVLTRGISRIDSDWKNNLAFFTTFKCNSWEYKSVFGGRVVPTKIKREALSAGFQVPQGEIEPSAFHDTDAEDVREKAREELREESERVDMGAEDNRRDLPQVEDEAPPGVAFAEVEFIEEDHPDIEVGDEVQQDAGAGGAASSSHGNEAPSTPIFPDVDVPSTPLIAPHTPRGSPTTRVHADDDAVEAEHQSKRPKNEEIKRSRIQRITEEYAAHVNTVQYADESFHTMDNYETDLDIEQPDESFDLWADEDTLVFKDVPEDLWSDFNMERQPPEPPERAS
eukprot:s1774_g15.t1